MEKLAKLSVEEEILIRKYNELTLKYTLPEACDKNAIYSYISRYHVVAGTACQFKIIAFPMSCSLAKVVYMSINEKNFVNKDFNYTFNVSIPEFNIEHKFTVFSGTWILLEADFSGTNCNFAVTVKIDLVSKVQPLGCLYDDEDLTDFELRGEDGSIRVHRAVLAAASPVLRRMLCGTWKETTEGHVEVPGTSKSTLQHLKDFIYLHTLPETGLEQLALLASYYMMHNLEIECINKMVNNITASNAFDMLDYATNNKLLRLNLAILESVHNGSVNIDDIRKYVNIHTASGDEGATVK